MSQNILLVDDSPTLRSVLKVYLSARGAQFLEASDGGEAYALVHQHPIDLVIADVRMPGVDGVSFVRKLRTEAAEGARGVPVILLTSDKSDALRSEALEAGANALVNKPITPASLQAVIAELVPEPK